MSEAPDVIISGTVFDGDRLHKNHSVVVRGTRVTDLVPRSTVARESGPRFDLGSDILVPGFLDLQVNGGGGMLFNDAPTPETITAIGTAHAPFGTVGFLPTLITDTDAVMRRAVDAVSVAIDAGSPGVLGIHLEGPHLNPVRRGVHDASRIRPLDAPALARLTSLERGVTVVTLAPEVTDAATIRRLARAGVVVCAGHSDADLDTVRRALDAGLAGFTHLFNGMPPLESRAPGLVGAALADERGWFGIIADGHHVHPASIRVAVAAKRRGGAVLVTDAMPVVGTALRMFTLNGAPVRVAGGRCLTADGGLAGSMLTMIEAVNNAAHFADIDWFEAVRMASLYPAAALGIDGIYGRIQPGYRASFVAVDTKRRVTRVWIDGVLRVG